MSRLPRHRAIVAVDIESSTTRSDPVKADLRHTAYDLFEQALQTAGISAHNRDPFTDRGDGILALIHPVDQAPKPILLNQTIPALARLLTDHNISRSVIQEPQQRLRLRAVVHAGEVHYDNNGCFGEALDLAFRLLDAAPVKKKLQLTPAPLVLVVSEDIYRSIVWHGYDGINQQTYHPLVCVQIAGRRHHGWIHVPGQCPAPDTRSKTSMAASLSPATGKRPPDMLQPMRPYTPARSARRHTRRPPNNV